MGDHPMLPKAVVHRATWDGEPGWSQYHDERDPLPDAWDDEEPDEVMGFYDGAQMREAIEAAFQRGKRAGYTDGYHAAQQAAAGVRGTSNDQQNGGA
jgi:hypothetical protein